MELSSILAFSERCKRFLLYAGLEGQVPQTKPTRHCAARKRMLKPMLRHTWQVTASAYSFSFQVPFLRDAQPRSNLATVGHADDAAKGSPRAHPVSATQVRTGPPGPTEALVGLISGIRKAFRIVSVSAGIKQQHFRRFCSSKQQTHWRGRGTHFT
jgi:hypothetical protein